MSLRVLSLLCACALLLAHERHDDGDVVPDAERAADAAAAFGGPTENRGIAGVEQLDRHGAVERAGVQVRQAKPRRERARDRTFAGRRWRAPAWSTGGRTPARSPCAPWWWTSCRSRPDPGCAATAAGAGLLAIPRKPAEWRWRGADRSRQWSRHRSGPGAGTGTETGTETGGEPDCTSDQAVCMTLSVPDDYAGPPYTYGDYKNIAIFSSTEHPEAAWRFARYLVTRAADLRLLEVTKQIPVRRDLLTDSLYADFFQHNPKVVPFARQAPYTRGVDAVSSLTEVLDAIAQQYEAAAVYGVRSPAEATREAVERIRLIHEWSL